MSTSDSTTPTGGTIRVPIDPRIRERRIAVRRDEGRRRLRLLVIGGSVVAAGLLGWLATRSPLLDVDTVRVVGSLRTTAARVVDATGVERGDAMLDVDDGAVAARVRALPWVDTASVRRSWPGTVEVTVTERRPVAAARGPSRSATQETWLLVDADGRLLATQSRAQEGLPAIEGGPFGDTPGASIADAGKGALRVARAIGPERVAQIPVVAVVGDDQLELRLAGPKPGTDASRTALEGGGGVVRFGPADQIREKLLAVFTVLDNVDLRGLAVLDVRVPSAPVITRRTT